MCPTTAAAAEDRGAKEEERGGKQPQQITNAHNKGRAESSSPAEQRVAGGRRGAEDFRRLVGVEQRQRRPAEGAAGLRAADPQAQPRPVGNHLCAARGVDAVGCFLQRDATRPQRLQSNEPQKMGRHGGMGETEAVTGCVGVLRGRVALKPRHSGVPGSSGRKRQRRGDGQARVQENNPGGGCAHMAESPDPLRSVHGTAWWGHTRTHSGKSGGKRCTGAPKPALNKKTPAGVGGRWKQTKTNNTACPVEHCTRGMKTAWGRGVAHLSDVVPLGTPRHPHGRVGRRTGAAGRRTGATAHTVWLRASVRRRCRRLRQRPPHPGALARGSGVCVRHQCNGGDADGRHRRHGPLFGAGAKPSPCVVASLRRGGGDGMGRHLRGRCFGTSLQRAVFHRLPGGEVRQWQVNGRKHVQRVAETIHPRWIQHFLPTI